MNENPRSKSTKSLSCFFLTFLILYLPASTYSQPNPTPPTGMVFIPEGYFPMGNSSGREDEKPLHFVYTKAFFIDKHEVSNAEYMEFIEVTKHAKPTFWEDETLNLPNHPVVGVSWRMLWLTQSGKGIDYLQRLNGKNRPVETIIGYGLGVESLTKGFSSTM